MSNDNLYQNITRRQAFFLNKLSDASANLRRVAKELSDQALRDIELVNAGNTPRGGSHQTLMEYTIYTTEVKTLLATATLNFPMQPEATDEAKMARRDEVDGYLTLALKEATEDNYRITGGFYFMSIEDKKNDK